MAVRLILLFATAFFVSACGTKPPPLTITKELDGKRVFNSKCAHCHGEKGTRAPARGVRVANLNELEVQNALGLYRIGKRNHFSGGALMQSQAKNLNDNEIAAVAKYIDQL